MLSSYIGGIWLPIGGIWPSSYPTHPAQFCSSQQRLHAVRKAEIPIFPLAPMWLHATSGEHHTTQSNTAHKEHGQTQSHHGNGASKAKLAHKQHVNVAMLLAKLSQPTKCIVIANHHNAGSKAKLAHIMHGQKQKQTYPKWSHKSTNIYIYIYTLYHIIYIYTLYIIYIYTLKKKHTTSIPHNVWSSPLGLPLCWPPPQECLAVFLGLFLVFKKDHTWGFWLKTILGSFVQGHCHPRMFHFFIVWSNIEWVKTWIMDIEQVEILGFHLFTYVMCI